MIEEVQAMGAFCAVVGSIIVVGALICCALIHSMFDLKAAQMNMLCSLIWELMLYKFELGYNLKDQKR